MAASRVKTLTLTSLGRRELRITAVPAASTPAVATA